MSLLRLLHVEDDPLDAELVAETLRAGGIAAAITRVSSEPELRGALARQGFDLVITDYNLPGFSGSGALRVLQTEQPEVPVLVVSGAIGEERAIACIREGATDYVLKDGLARLAPAVRRALSEASDRARRARAEAALADSHRLLQRITGASPTATFLYDLRANRVVYAGGRLEQVLQASAEALLATEGFPLERIAVAGDLGVVRDHLHQVRAAADDQVVEVEVRIAGAGAGRAEWRHVRSLLFERRDGAPALTLSLVEDVTERRELETQLLRHQRLESIGTLAGGIAHDLNNVLTPITMGGETLYPTLGTPEQRALVTTILQSAARGSDLVRQILTFARGSAGEHRPVDLRRLVEDSLALLKDSFSLGVAVRVTVAPDLWPVVGDVTQLHQVLLNLCVNARDAMPAGGQLSLTLENVTVDDGYVRLHLDAEPGAFVVLTVTDTGSGIPAKLIDRIFEPFFTTKPVGQGTGLGLSTTRTIVRAHGGFLNVYSVEGEGTAFKVYLPARVAPAPPTAAFEDARPLDGRGELILVADDEVAIREMARAVLERHGYRVLVAADGAEAIDIVERHPEPIAALITDARMPRLDGAAAIRAIRVRAPAIRCLIASGMLHDLPAGVGFLRKPYSIGDLLRTLRQALDTPA